jgi:hypothetical protein
MPNTSAYQLMIKAVRRPFLFAREKGRPILVLTGDSTTEPVDDIQVIQRWSPSAVIEGNTGPDIIAIIKSLVSPDGLTRWVPGTLLPPPRFPRTEFILWAWQVGNSASKTPSAEDYRQSFVKWRRGETFKGRELQRWADYVGRTVTTWLPASGLAAFGLQQFMDGVNLVLWLVSPVVAVTIALLHAVLLIRGRISYRWFYKAPYLKRAKGEKLAEYAQRIGGAVKPDQGAAAQGADKRWAEHREQVERLLVAAFLEDLRQAYRRHPFGWSWPGWGRHTYPVVGIKNAEPGSQRRRFMELVEEVRVDTGQRSPLLLVVSTSTMPDPRRPLFDAGGVDNPGELYKKWRRAMRGLQPSPYLMYTPEKLDNQDGGDVPLKLRPLRAMAFWAFVLALVAAPVTAVAVKTVGCGSELRQVDEQCVGLGALDQIEPHEIVRPVVEKIEEQNAAIPFGKKIIKIAYLGPLTTQPGAQFKDGQMAAVAGELTGIGAYQADFNKGKSDWKIKVLFANTGQDFVGAKEAATGVAEHARDDPSLAAVVGFAWSRDEVKKAVAELTKADIPMVSTVTTVDQIAGEGKKRSPYFYRLAVVDSLQVKATVHWLERIKLDAKVGRRPEVAVIWQREKNELYSQDLRNLFLSEYRGKKTAFEFSDDASLDDAVRTACQSSAKVLYYTGRADFLDTVKRSWGAACESRGVRLLASDDVTGRIANEVHRDAAKHNVTMSFVSLTDARNPSGNQSQAALWQWADRVTRNFSYVHAAFGWDAVQAVTTAFNTYRNQRPDAPDEDRGSDTHDANRSSDAADEDQDSGVLDIRSGVHYNLRGLHFYGASGEVTFPSHLTEHDAQGRTVWLMNVEAGKPIQAVRECRVTSEDPCGRAKDTAGSL